tara:strand:- start:129 stop:452 length:324 start_codon:yes stop_codon:yes gene_type:complete
MNYRSQLKAFKKILFDPFRRRERIVFHYDKNKEISTTIGQLNFFRWAIENDIIKCLQSDIIDVEKDMFNRQKHSRSSKKDLKKTIYMNKNSIKNMTTFKGNTLLSFK